MSFLASIIQADMMDRKEMEVGRYGVQNLSLEQSLDSYMEKNTFSLEKKTLFFSLFLFHQILTKVKKQKVGQCL